MSVDLKHDALSLNTPSRPNAAAPVDIDARDLWKSYMLETGENLPVFQGIDFSVAQHEMVALVGPSGCGKSTLLNVLAGFEKQDRGTLLVGGRPVEAPS